jgi:hypothetical protein
MKKMAVVLILALCAVGQVWAGEAGDRRLVTVTGTSEVKAVPDEVEILLGVETLKMDLLLAKKTNDQGIKKIMAMAQKFAIDPKDVQTSEISVEPQYDEITGKPRVFSGYLVRNTMVITLKDLSKFEAFLGGILTAGANSIQGVYFQSSQIQQLKVQARKMAVQAARDKAESLAGELGQKIGRPFSIVDGDNTWVNGGTFANSQVTFGNGGIPADSREQGNDLSPGQIVIRQNVTVSFELQ